MVAIKETLTVLKWATNSAKNCCYTYNKIIYHKNKITESNHQKILTDIRMCRADPQDIHLFLGRLSKLFSQVIIVFLLSQVNHLHRIFCLCSLLQTAPNCTTDTPVQQQHSLYTNALHASCKFYRTLKMALYLIRMTDEMYQKYFTSLYSHYY